MRKTLLIIAFIATSFSALAQTNKVDKRLLVKYTAEEINTIKAENPEEYKFLNYCIENAFYIGGIPEEKVKADPSAFKEIVIETIPISNFFDLSIALLESQNQYFIIKGTKKLLVVKSKSHIFWELNK